MNMDQSFTRYQRQMSLKGFGKTAQQKLFNAKVLVVGAGGLGCPALSYLTGAGIGTIGIIDDDIVTLENLHRQTIYSTSDIGFSKAEIASNILQELNPEISIISYQLRLITSNCIDIFSEFDIILDCTDNFATRYMINDACVLLGKALVSGAVSQFEGQVAIFNSTNNLLEEPVNYRDLFPDPPQAGEVKNCAELGVLGVLPGIIGIIQAGEVIKLITGIGTPLVNRLLTYNLLNNQTYELILTKGQTISSKAPENITEFLKTDYEWFCGNQHGSFDIDIYQFDEILDTGNALVIDVREKDEVPEVSEFSYLNIPLSELKINSIKSEKDTIIFFCQTGKRSTEAAKFLKTENNKLKTLYSLHGGIINWKKNSKRSKHD
jgi:sulfur-carrier protein adenylyltransferase/sulfurtransferase